MKKFIIVWLIIQACFSIRTGMCQDPISDAEFAKHTKDLLDKFEAQDKDVKDFLEQQKAGKEKKYKSKKKIKQSDSGGPYNFTLSDALGGFNLSDDPVVQAARRREQVRASQNTISSESQIEPLVQFLQYDKEDYDKYLEPGEHSGTPQELDKRVAEAKQEEIRNWFIGILGISLAGLLIYRYRNS